MSLVGRLAGPPPNLTFIPAGRGLIMIGYNANDGMVTAAPGIEFIRFTRRELRVSPTHRRGNTPAACNFRRSFR